MNEKDLVNFLSEMKNTVLAAGEIAKKEQGKVRNVGKEIEKSETDSDYVRKRQEAKTIIDDQVQEMILSAVANIFDPKKIYLDAEENTPSVNLFAEVFTGLTLVIDPIDGTLEYISGTDNYSINVGLVENGRIIFSLVYFPAKGDLYYQKTSRSFYEKDKQVKEIQPPQKIIEKTIYTSDRVQVESINKLRESGFQVIRNEENGKRVLWPEALLGCLKGEIGTCLFHSPQMRDVLLGAMISSLPGGYACDQRGEKIKWPEKGRIPFVIFGFGKVPSEITNSNL